MKRNKAYKLEIKTINTLEQIKKENDYKYDAMFQMLINLYNKKYGHAGFCSEERNKDKQTGRHSDEM